MKAKKHIEFDRVFAYLTEDKTDILWFTNEDEMRRVGECLVEMTRFNDILQVCAGGIIVTKVYVANGIAVRITYDKNRQDIMFASEKQMRRAGQCLIDLARIGGSEVEIKDEQ